MQEWEEAAMRPLYRELAGVSPSESAHPGLIFDKYIDQWAPPPNTKPGDGAKGRFYAAIRDRVQAMGTLLDQRLDAARLRRSRLVLSRGGRLYTAQTASRLIIGLGSGHPFEAGLTWHPTLGVPYLPGSSIKGMVRALADPRDKQGNAGWGNPADWPTVKRLFGDTNDLGAGSIIVFDAVSTSCPQLDVEIMTPHYGPYYKAPTTNPPADWYSPVPISFLTVAESQEFQFALAPRCPKGATSAGDLVRAKDLLEQALQCLGAGGKTAVGYGRFGNWDDVTDAIKRQLETVDRRAKQDRLAAEQQAKLASVTGLDRELAEFTFKWQEAGNPQTAAAVGEGKATEWFQRFGAAPEQDKQKIAQALKLFYVHVNKWSGRQLSDKQRVKVITIKRLLGEEESRGL